MARTVLKNLLLGLLATLFLLPFYIMLRNSLITTQQITSPSWHWLPWPLTFDNFRELFSNPAVPMAGALANSC